MSNGITRETFSGMPSEDKLNVLFDLSVDNNRNIKALKTKMDTRKKWDTAASLIGGFFGGAGVIIGKWMFWKG